MGAASPRRQGARPRDFATGTCHHAPVTNDHNCRPRSARSRFTQTDTKEGINLSTPTSKTRSQNFSPLLSLQGTTKGQANVQLSFDRTSSTREDFTTRFATINDLPGIIVDAPEGPVQTAAFEIDGDVIRALYVVRNPDKLRHLAAPPPQERGPG